MAGTIYACPKCNHAPMAPGGTSGGRQRLKCPKCGCHPAAHNCVKIAAPTRAPLNTTTTLPRKDTEVFRIETTLGEVPDGCDHYFIGDLQCKDGVDLSYCTWIGKDIAARQPDVITNIGDHADMPSLSSYDKGKKKAEGRRVAIDIEAAIEGMRRLLRPIYELQQQQLKDHGKVLYKPRLIFTMGNHEERILRHVEAHPELDGFLGLEDLRYQEFGWEVYDFLVPALANGVAYCHYFANPMSGKPYGGSVLNILSKVGQSFSMGHKQTLDICMRYLPANGQQQIGLINGASYPHDEGYKGPQGNKHFRGTIHKKGVADGGYTFEIISLDELKKLYG